MEFGMESFQRFAENSSLGRLCLVLTILMGMDVFTGLVAAAINKGASSSRMREGLLRKLLVFVAVFVAVLMQYVYPPMWTGTAMALWFITREVLSIVEKCGKAGVQFPPQFMERLAQLNGSENKETKSLVTANISVGTVAANMPPGTIMPVVVPAHSDSSILREAMH